MAARPFLGTSTAQRSAVRHSDKRTRRRELYVVSDSPFRHAICANIRLILAARVRINGLNHVVRRRDCSDFGTANAEFDSEKRGCQNLAPVTGTRLLKRSASAGWPVEIATAIFIEWQP
jgi:hypothetical protein